jgi:RND family efflux transporter MFP subunit
MTPIHFARLTKPALGAWLMLAVFGLGCCGGTSGESSKSAKPVEVRGSTSEAELATLTLTPQAETRLGIRIVTLERRRVNRVRILGGEVVVPPGQTVTVVAPVAGTLAPPGPGTVPAGGASLQKGQAVFNLLPLERDLQAEAERELANAHARLETAQARVKRTDQLLRDKAGSVRALEEARAELAQAQAAREAAQTRANHLRGMAFEPGGALRIQAPDGGVLQELHAAPGQTVAAGTPLFVVASMKSLWVRVPVYAGDLKTLDAERPATVRDLAAPPGAAGRAAMRVGAPLSADPNAATVDLYYQISGDGPLRPGQKVDVSVALRGEEEALVAPWSAIVQDIHGGTWVYVNIAPQTYARRRVEVRYVTGGLAVLARGPSPGAKVVATGAAELFGAEFATGK